MRRPRFFCPQIAPGSVVLPPDEAHHALTVLRGKAGREIALFDGAGTVADAVISEQSRRGDAAHEKGRLRVEVKSVYTRPFDLAYRITLAVAMIKPPRQAYLIEKCTELGAAAIWPVIGERSVARPSKAATDKWSRRAIEAAKQCHRAWVPEVAAPIGFAECLERLGEFDASAVALAESATLPFLNFLSSFARGASLVVLIGPEGGWSDTEQQQAVAAGAVPVTLGPTVLRTETAGVAVCAAAALCTASDPPSGRGLSPRCSPDVPSAPPPRGDATG